MFPSFNAIEEIRIGETINSAEFGGVADITTISKAGTNSIHGGVFENVQNTDFNAADFFSHQVPLLKMNNFGIYMGGPVVLPKLYNGRDKTFFFASFEALRLPKSRPASRECSYGSRCATAIFPPISLPPTGARRTS